MHFKSLWAVLLVFLLSDPLNATETCRGCRSMDLQLAPGIGMELGLDYLTSAATFANGTTIDLIHLPGSDEYRALMRSTAAEAEAIQNGIWVQRGWMPWLNEIDHKANWRREHRILASLNDHYPRLRSYISVPPTPLLDIDQNLQNLVHSLTHLKCLSEAKLATPISEVSISFPSIADLLGQSFAGYIRQSLREAGFIVPMNNDGDAVQHIALSRSVEIIGPTLSLEYSDAALCLSTQLPNAEQTDYPFLERAGVWMGLGSGFENANSTEHEARLRAQVEDFLAGLEPAHRPVTQVLLSGTASSSDLLHQVVAGIFPDINKESYQCESFDDYIFAAARGAAKRARDGMLYSEDLRMPDPGCELAEGHPWKQSRDLQGLIESILC